MSAAASAASVSVVQATRRMLVAASNSASKRAVSGASRPPAQISSASTWLMPSWRATVCTRKLSSPENGERGAISEA